MTFLSHREVIEYRHLITAPQETVGELTAYETRAADNHSSLHLAPFACRIFMTFHTDGLGPGRLYVSKEKLLSERFPHVALTECWAASTNIKKSEGPFTGSPPKKTYNDRGKHSIDLKWNAFLKDT